MQAWQTTPMMGAYAQPKPWLNATQSPVPVGFLVNQNAKRDLIKLLVVVS
jgi:hypothetical protein